jgi:hypothetical protein
MLLLPSASAVPRVPSEFRGWVIISGAYARDGTEIKVLDGSGTVCGVSVVEDGYYGPLSCLGDDSSTGIDEGAELNEPLTFMVDGMDLGTKDSVRWQPGLEKEVNLLKGDVKEAELFLLRQGNPSDTVSLLILSALVICSLCLITFVSLYLSKFVSGRKKKLRGLQVE